MENNELSGIERELVLQYLLDGNVPVTISPANIDTQDGVHPLESAVIPVAIQAEKISVLKEGIILLDDDVPESVQNLIEKPVKVEFYFNRVGLFFVTPLKKVSSGPALVIPNVIHRIVDIPVQKKYDFSARLVFSTGENGTSSFVCVPAEGFELFSRPAWSSIELEKQQKAKEYLENFVKQTGKDGKAGNGIQLINVCRYMVEEKPYRIEAVEGRVKPFEIIFVNHERLVFAFEHNKAFELTENAEYPVELYFVLNESPAVIRKVFVMCKVNKIYENEDSSKKVADCPITLIQEEDVRFLYEKTTKSLFL